MRGTLVFIRVLRENGSAGHSSVEALKATLTRAILEEITVAANQLSEDEKRIRRNANKAAWRERNLERVREMDRAAKAKWRETHADVNRARTAAWRELHPDENRSSIEQFHEKNPDYKRQYNARYVKEHAEEIRLHRQSRRDEIRAASARWYIANQERERARARKWNAENPERAAENYRRFMALPENRMRILVNRAISRARKLGVECDESILELSGLYPKECACCGVTFDYSKKVLGLAPSLDRVDNSGGYTADNVRVICHRCNSLKRNASIGDLEQILAYMRRG
jgi:hypothetical protein